MLIVQLNKILAQAINHGILSPHRLYRRRLDRVHEEHRRRRPAAPGLGGANIALMDINPQRLDESPRSSLES